MILNLTLVGFELFFLALLALTLHAWSRRYGLAPLLILLSGLVAILHVTSPIQVRIDLGWTYVVVSSVTLVPIILLSILVLYVVEGTAAARVAILATVSLSLLVLLFQMGLAGHMHLPGGANALGLPADSPVFDHSWPYTVASALAFAGSLVAIVVVHQTISNGPSWIPAWVAPGGALLAALAVDEFLFKAATFWTSPLVDWTWGGLMGKTVAGVLLWPPAAYYLIRVAPRLEGYAGTLDRRPFEVLFGSYKSQEVALRVTAERRRRAERALEASELRFRNTFEQAGVGLIHSELDGRLLMANRAVCDLLGYTEEELKKLRWQDITHPEDLPDNEMEVLDLLEGRKDRYETDKRYVRSDGEEVWAHVTASLVRERKDGDPYFVVAIEDLTERMATEERLRQAQKMEAVGQLTGGVAHDFNNLLTVIMGGLELGMDRSTTEEEKRKVLEEALRAAKRGASLTQRLLAFSRKQALRPTSLDTMEVLSGMRELLVRTLGETIRIRIESGSEVGSCMADRTQLENAVLNLCLNARDAMPRGGELLIRADRVRVSPTHLPTPEVQPGQYVQIAIADEGTGIPVHQLGKIFDPFFTTKGTGKGSGLGLSMVYGFARQSGGFVTVQSEEGRGTSIQLHLPVSP
ncbi:MAG: PAS domain S-box protein [Longimicrobiales bacterium]